MSARAIARTGLPAAVLAGALLFGVRVRPVAEDALERWSRVAEAAGDSIGLEWRAGVAEAVADPDRIAQALDNILANAFEHGTPPVRVSAAVRDRRVQIV